MVRSYIRPEEKSPQIIGIVLVKNEDRFIKTILENIVKFCDQIILYDNYSNDNTYELMFEFAKNNAHKCVLKRVKSVNGTHDILRQYAGTNSWIFAVDGDEIYDPVGLEIFKIKIKNGDFKKWWCIFGNVLNCTFLDENNYVAEGYLAPPSRSMTKLYNFSCIHSWDNGGGERLHGGTPIFKSGYSDSLRYDMFNDFSWEKAYFRCLHVCFIKRSSSEKCNKNGLYARLQPAELSGTRFLHIIRSIFSKKSQGLSSWKTEKYMRGELTQKDVISFFTKFD